MASRTFCTSYCNKPHRLSDGKPVGHECFILPSEALHAEVSGDVGRAQTILSGWKKRRAHKGLKNQASEDHENA